MKFLFEKFAVKITVAVVLFGIIVGMNYLLDLPSEYLNRDAVRVDNQELLGIYQDLNRAYEDNNQEEIENIAENIKYSYQEPLNANWIFFFLSTLYFIPVCVTGILFGTAAGAFAGIGAILLLLLVNAGLLDLIDMGNLHYIVFVTYVICGVLTGFLSDQKLKIFETESKKTKEEFMKLSAKYNKVASSEEQLLDNIKKADKKILRLSSFVTVFYNLARDIGSALELDKVLENIQKAVVRLLEAEKSELILLDENQKVLRPKTCTGWNEDEVEKIKNIEIKLGEGIIGWVAKEGKLLSSNEVQKDYRLATLGQHEILNSVLCAPLKVGNEIIGVINIGQVSSGTVTQEDTRLLYILSSLAAMAIKNAKMFAHIQRLADIDGLTQLYCNRYFQKHLEMEIKRCTRYKENFSIIMTDIDHFKSFNDTYGHQVGDMVLARTAEIIKKNIRQDIDIVARYGGEEFIIIVPKTDQKGAYILAERIRKQVEAATYIDDTVDHPLKVTISLGIATFPDHSMDKEELIRISDQGLYISKQTGRNRTSIVPVKEVKSFADPATKEAEN